MTRPLNARKGCGHGLCGAVVAEDVVRARGDSVEAHGIRDDAGNRLRFGLADRLGRPLVLRKLLVQELVRQLVCEDVELLGAGESREKLDLAAVRETLTAGREELRALDRDGFRRREFV